MFGYLVLKNDNKVYILGVTIFYSVFCKDFLNYEGKQNGAE